jgi:nitroimidazol reductase NimA-like FMN-containing flavoprotein (pyridoxamine 5'-phosphate oxidase superfamily)
LDRDAQNEALSLIASMYVCTVATCGAGLPHAVSLLYAHSGFHLYWLSDPTSIHSRHIDAETRTPVAAVIAAEHTDFNDIRGLQMLGFAQRLSEPKDVDEAKRLLIDRYPYLSESGARPAEITAALRRAAFYCFSPTRITWIDNTKGLGTKTIFVPETPTH